MATMLAISFRKVVSVRKDLLVEILVQIFRRAVLAECEAILQGQPILLGWDKSQASSRLSISRIQPARCRIKRLVVLMRRRLPPLDQRLLSLATLTRPFNNPAILRRLQLVGS